MTDITVDFVSGQLVTDTDLNSWKGNRTGSILPISPSTFNYTNNTYALGSTSYRWSTVNSVAGNFSGTVTANAFSGDGSALTSLNATQLSSGTIPSGRVTGSYTGITAVGTLSTLVCSSSVSTPSIITASGALGITPASGSNLNITLATTGDFAVNTNQFYVDTSAATVGIGTATPLAKFDVQGGTFSGNYISSRFNASNASVAMSSFQSNGNAYIGFNTNQTSGSDGQTYSLSQPAASIVGNPGSNALSLRVAASGTAGNAITWVDAVSLTPGGSVGIGTTAPASNLHIYSATSTAIQTIESVAANQNSQLKIKNSIDTWSIGQNILLTSGQLEFYQASSNLNRMVINSSGQIGIGMTPARTLDVTGTAGFTGAVSCLSTLAVTSTMSSAQHTINSGASSTVGIQMTTGYLNCVNNASTTANSQVLAIQGVTTAANNGTTDAGAYIYNGYTYTGTVTISDPCTLRLGNISSSSGSLTFTRASYIACNNISGTNVTVTNACLFYTDAAIGTHKMIDAATTKTTPGGVDAWIKWNSNGTVIYTPGYLSKTA